MSLAPRIDRIDRNSWINGNFDFWQRWAGVTNTINTATGISAYHTDRLLYATSGATVKNFSIVRSTDVPTFIQSGHQSQYSYLLTCITPIASPAAGDAVNNEYRMEGLDYARFHGKTGYLNFWVKNSVAGTYPISVYANNPVNMTLVTSYTVNSPNTWEYKSIPLTFQSAGGYAFDNSWQISIRLISGAIGSTYVAPSINTWVSGNYLTHSSITGNIMGAAGQTIRMAQVSLTETPMAAGMGYERFGRSYAGELLACQRYYEKSYSIEVVPGTNVGVASGDSCGGRAASSNPYIDIFFKINKRAAATVTFYAQDGTINAWLNGTQAGNRPASVTRNSSTVKTTVSIAGAVNNGDDVYGHFTADAEL